MLRRSLTLACPLALALALQSGPAAAQGNPPSAPAGTEVEVNLTDGGRLRGRLQSLSGAELVIRQRGKDARLPLSQVSTVVRRTHTVRNGALWGLIIGAPAGVLILSCNPRTADDCRSRYSWSWLNAPFGAGIGAGVGAIVGLVRKPSFDEQLVYRAQKKSPTFVVVPMVSPTVRGMGLTMRW